MRGFLKEFKNFAIKGNMIDMAIGIIIGTAFNNVVNVLVKKVFMPPLLVFTEQASFEDQKIIIREATEELDAIAIEYGALIEALIDFLIIGLTVFVVVKGINRFKKKSEDPENATVETPKNIELLSKIEKLLEEQNMHLKQK